MNWLLWREYRRNRLILGTGFVLVLLPYVMVVLIGLWDVVSQSNIPTNYDGAFYGAYTSSLCISQLTLALIAGNAMAGERTDRSAEFIAYLPLERLRRLMSKLALCLLVMVTIWGINFLIFGANYLLCAYDKNLGFQIELVPNALKGLPLFLAQVWITGLTFFGVAWLVSSFQSSTTFAVAGGLFTPMVVTMTFTGIAILFSMSNEDAGRFISTGYVITCAILAVVCFGVGTGYYLKRREP